MLKWNYKNYDLKQKQSLYVVFRLEKVIALVPTQPNVKTAVYGK